MPPTGTTAAGNRRATIRASPDGRTVRGTAIRSVSNARRGPSLRPVSDAEVQRDGPQRAHPRRRQLQLTISETGDVTEVRVLEGLPMGLTEKAVEAAKQWKYRPATQDGTPVAVSYTAVVNFQLQ